MSPEKQLVAYALALDYDSIDAVSRDHVRDIILDTLGIAIGAAALKHDSGLLCEDYTLEKYAGAPGGAATLWSGKGTLPPDEAALCNGTYAEVLDYQDVVVEPRNNGHAGVTIIPAAVAAARAAGQASGVAHMGAHALGAAAYAAKAAELAAPDDADARASEVRWQLAHMTAEVRTALKRLPALGEDSAGPLGSGLLASGVLAKTIRDIQAELSSS